MKTTIQQFRWLAACVLMFALFQTSISAQAVIGNKNAIGKWKTIDDETKEPKSIVEIYIENGKITGKIVKLFRKPEEDQNPKCEKCEDYRKNQPIIGMVIIRNMVASAAKYSGGDILDPKKGEVYTCTMWLEDENTLKVRGWWGMFYRTQTWHRTE